jgi:hypothetical protein
MPHTQPYVGAITHTYGGTENLKYIPFRLCYYQQLRKKTKFRKCFVGRLYFQLQGMTSAVIRAQLTAAATAAILLQPDLTGARDMARGSQGGPNGTAATRVMAATQLQGGIAFKT